MTEQPNRETDVIISLGDLHSMIVHCVERAYALTRLDMGLDDITAVISKEISEGMQPVDAHPTEQ